MTPEVRSHGEVYLEPEHTDTTFMWRADCRWFVGGLPCKYWRPCHNCDHYASVGSRILIVMLGLLGDMLIASALPGRIKRDDPRAHVSWLVDAPSAQVLRMNPDVDRVLIHGWETSTQLLSESFDVVLGFERAPSAAAIVDRVTATHKAGIAHGGHDNTLYAIGDAARHFFKMNTWNDFRAKRNTKTWTELYFEVAGYEYTGEPYVLQVPRDAEETVERYLGPRDRLRVCLNMGGSLQTKLLPRDSWIAVGRALVDRGTQVVVTGGPEQHMLCESVVAAISKVADVDAVLYRPLTLEEFSAVPRACDAIITGDSYAFHLALAYDTPCVLLLGPSHAAEILPRHARHVNIVRSTLPCSPCAHQVACGGMGGCMDTIQPSAVMTATLDAIDAAPRR